MLSKRNTLVLLVLATLIATGAVQAAAEGAFSVTPVTESRDAAAGQRTWSVAPEGPGWLPLPRLGIVLPGGTGSATVQICSGPGEPWREVELVDGRGSLPFSLPNAAALWEVRLRTADSLAASPQIVPLDPLVLTSEGPVRAEAPALVTVTRWGEAAWLKVRAVDAVGAPIALETLAGADGGPDGEGWHDLGYLNGTDQGSLRVHLTPDLSFPVLVEAQTDAGETGVLVLAPEDLLAGAADMIHYYGMAKPNWNCATRVYDGTYLWIVGIEDGTTYTVTDLDTAGVLATGTVNRGDKASLVSPNPTFVDNHRFRLATSRPVQAYMGFDCSGTLPGSMFFLADDGRSMYGSAFTVPVGGLDGRTRYVVFASGAGSAEIRTISGTPVASHTFAAAGYWDATASLTAGTVYAVTSSGTTVAVQQSSQNTATEVPPTTMVVGGGTCTPSSLGNKFYVHIQDWNGTDPALVAIGYQDVDWRFRQLPSGGWTNSTVRTGNTRRRTVTEGFYEVEVTTTNGTMGLLAGSYEGGAEIWDLGDDSVYYRGTGSEVRGHALRCGGSIFVAHDGTYLDETGATTTPALPATLNAGDVVTLNGNTSTNTPFRIYSQDADHPIVVEVFGGNCATQLNDWSKVMHPAALARPVITYPDASGYLNDLTPDVTGTAIPGVTVTLRVYDHTTGDALVFTGTATADGTGAWTIPVTDPLTENHLYYFEAVQSLDGVCPVDPLPPPGSSGSQGQIDTTPPAAPAVTAIGTDTGTSPSDGITSDNTLVFSGTAEAGALVHVFLDGVEIGTTLADGSGAWSFDYTGTPLADGTYAVTARAEDAAHNLSPVSAPFNAVVDTTPPAAPTVTALTTNDTTPEIHGTLGAALEAGDVFTVTVHGVTYTAGDGNLVVSGTDWTLTVPAGNELPEGTYPVTATVTDAAGNAASDASTNELVIDTTPPAAPVVLTPTNGSLTNDATPAITGTAEAGSTVSVYLDGILAGTALADGSGNWTFTPSSPLADGPHTVYATATDAAGNTSANSNTNAFTVDTAAPAVTITAPAEGSTTGDSTPTISGTTDAAEGSTVTVTIGAESHTATVQADGSWSLDWPTVLPDASYTVSASVTDPAGNTGSDSNGFTVLATPPSTPPIVTSPLYAGASVTVYGSSVEAPGSLVTVYVGGVSAGTALVQADGSWSLAGVPLADGQVVTATVEAAGKLVSGTSNAVVVASGSGDLTPAPVIATPVAGGATSVTGTALPGAAVDVYGDGYYLGTAIADGSGNWSLGGLSPLPDGTLLSATATLAPGGTSTWSNTVVVGTAIHLLRSDDLTSLSQSIAPLFERRYPAFSSLAAMGPNHVANWGEGADATLPGTSDDDKAYVRGITSGTAEPDTAVLADNGRPLVFYELVDNGQKTLFLTKSGGNIVFTFTP